MGLRRMRRRWAARLRSGGEHVGTPQRNRVLARRRLHRDQRARLPAMRRHRHDAARSGRRQPSDTIRPVAPHEPGCPARQSASGQTGVAEHREHLRRRHVGSIPALGLGYQPKARGCGRACLRAVVLSSRKPHYPRQELITLVCLQTRRRRNHFLVRACRCCSGPARSLGWSASSWLPVSACTGGTGT